MYQLEGEIIVSKFGDLTLTEPFFDPRDELLIINSLRKSNAPRLPRVPMDLLLISSKYPDQTGILKFVFV